MQCNPPDARLRKGSHRERRPEIPLTEVFSSVDGKSWLGEARLAEYDHGHAGVLEKNRLGKLARLRLSVAVARLDAS